MKKYFFKNITLGLGILILVGCGSYGTIIKMQEVNKVPDGQYERIIKLYNPEGSPNKTLAGLVFIKKGASICTDYPREEIIKSVDELSMMEKISYKYSKIYTIKEGGKIFGFVSEPAEYMVTFWKNEKDENCIYKVQVTLISKDNNGDGGGFGSGHRGGHGGGHGR